jgi:predicted nuclease of predicted toxin-antitoxin system
MEKLQVRHVLKKSISLLSEVQVASRLATEDPYYKDLGLVDAAIGAVARSQNCCVLTDDLDLYLRLSHDKLKVVNFTHLRARAWGL